MTKAGDTLNIFPHPVLISICQYFGGGRIFFNLEILFLCRKLPLPLPREQSCVQTHPSLVLLFANFSCNHLHFYFSVRWEINRVGWCWKGLSVNFQVSTIDVYFLWNIFPISTKHTHWRWQRGTVSCSLCDPQHQSHLPSSVSYLYSWTKRENVYTSIWQIINA